MDREDLLHKKVKKYRVHGIWVTLGPETGTLFRLING